MLAHGLGVMLNLDAEQATALTFPMPLDRKIAWIGTLVEGRAFDTIKPIVSELKAVINKVQSMRNTVIHGILLAPTDERDDVAFYLRSKERIIPAKDVWDAEEVTNYACHVAAHFCWSLAEPHNAAKLFAALPDRPASLALPPRDSRGSA